MPVYVFTGFLEAGKTSFIQSTLEDKRFNSGERTLILLCEEGEEEFDFSKPGMDTVFVETIENEADLTPDRLKALEAKHNAERVSWNTTGCGCWQASTTTSRSIGCYTRS